MIGSLRGIIGQIFEDHILLDVNGVGYTVFMPVRVLATLNSGEEIFLLIQTNVREDDISLFGFPNFSDKDIFLKLNKINGIGAKTALAILGQMTAEQIIDAITFEDKASFTAVSGIGPKAATRIVTELKDKVAKDLGAAQIVQLKPGESQAPQNNNLLYDAISALENLGYQKSQIIGTVKNIIQDEQDLSKVITKSLQQIAK